MGRPSEDPSGPAAATVVTARPPDWSQVKASPSNQIGAHSRMRAVRTAAAALSCPFGVSAAARPVRGRRARTSTGTERSTVSGTAPLGESGTRPSAALAVATTTRARAARRAWAVDLAMGLKRNVSSTAGWGQKATTPGRALPSAHDGRVLEGPAEQMTAVAGDLAAIRRDIVTCRACPRLVEWRERVGREKAPRFADQVYWGRPVPGFGDPAARIAVVGLAPAAHGGNRTGRIFTGDRSGDFLYTALHRAELSSRPQSVSRDDGLQLRGVYLASVNRCAPPWRWARSPGSASSGRSLRLATGCGPGPRSDTAPRS